MHEAGQTRIETQRLALEPLRLDHAELCIENLRDVELYTYVPQDAPGHAQELRERYRRILRGSRSPDEVWLNWFGSCRSSGRYACFVQATVSVTSRSSLIAYQTFSPFRRKGLANEACRAVIAHLAATFGTRLVRAEIDSRNVASHRLVESLHFCRVALKQKADFFKGADSDEYVYELAIENDPDRPIK